jgi:hypothetical protein
MSESQVERRPSSAAPRARSASTPVKARPHLDRLLDEQACERLEDVSLSSTSTQRISRFVTSVMVSASAETPERAIGCFPQSTSSFWTMPDRHA